MTTETFLEIQWRTFASSSAIRIFSFIRSPVSKLEKIFWVTVLLIFTGGTIHSVIQSLGRHISEETSTRTIVNTSNEIVFNEHLTLCMQIRPSEIRFDFNISNLAEVLSFLDAFKSERSIVSLVNQTISKSVIKKSRNVEDDNMWSGQDDYFLPSAPPTNPELDTLMRLTIKLVVWLVRPEISARDNKAKNNNMQSEDYEKSLMLLYEFYSKRLDSIVAVAQATTRYIFYALGLVLSRSYDGDGFTQTVVRPWWNGVPVWLGRSFYYSNDFACLEIARDEGFHFRPGSYYMISLNRADNWIIGGNPDRSIFAYIYLKGYTVDTGFRVEAYLDSSTAIIIKYEGEYKMMNLRRRRCSEEMEIYTCKWLCRIKEIIRNCGCFPLAQFGYSHMKPKGLQFCASLSANSSRPNNPNECTHLTKKGTEEYSCQSNCISSCDLRVLSFRKENAISNDSLNGLLITKIVLQMNQVVYPVIEEYLTMSGDNFLVALGGNLSLYLGASFLALIHILVFLVRASFELYDYRMRNSGLANNETN